MIPLKDLNIVLVDSNKLNAELTLKILHRIAQNIVHFTSLEESSKFIDSGCKVDLIILDLFNPTKYCLELVDAIREHVDAALPVLVLAGTDIENTIEQCECNRIKILMKPMELDKFYGLISVLVEKTEI